MSDLNVEQTVGAEPEKSATASLEEVASFKLRAVMLALDGFCRQHSIYLRQLFRYSRLGSNWSPSMVGSKSLTRCGRDEVHFSMPLFSLVDPNPVSSGELHEVRSGLPSEKA
ncbi:hypothetical protein Ddye_013023 [Dipteronia dyeriana]|uniref:Uncharacterized protein n=1 Tax=Dipteronia dyeriana TaxID=168575 RepID=A0AAD9X5N2_9ROSI|nr:hypothetical protein Ddye_013023 [Dipteronia dyeriana]